MDSKKLGLRATSPAPPRAPLTDISNSPALSSCTKIHDNAFSSQLRRGNAELQQELEALKKTLKEREEIIDAQKQNMEKLWLKCCRKSRQNDDIIQHNAQLYKDLMQTRDKLKILQHENIQMATVYNISKSELQLKLTEALDHGKRLQALLDNSAIKKASDKDLNAPMLTKSLDGCVASGENKLDCSGESSLACHEKLIGSFEDNPVLCKTAPRQRDRRENSVGGSSCQIMPKKTDGDSREELHKYSEGEDLSLAASSISSNSQAKLAQEISPLPSDTIPLSEGNSTASTSVTFAKASKARHTQSMSLADSGDLSHKNSTDRPPRRAVSSVGSYKEPPLNTKMRRPD